MAMYQSFVKYWECSGAYLLLPIWHSHLCNGGAMQNWPQAALILIPHIV